MPETGCTSGASIELENLTKRYPGSADPAVDNVSMEIKAGEIVIFVGPSGCGKSTTLKMINRLIEPTGGRIRIDGEDVTDMDPVKLRRKVGYAIQSSGLFPHMTVAQNIALVPKMIGWSKARIRDRVEEMLDLVGLDPGEFHGRYPRQLSGGQQQRVGVARALAADPPVLLMDEPFGAVDPITRDHLQDELIRLQHELHKTIVFVTHDFDEAIKLGDRIAVLRERSHIAQFDTPEAILTNPADDFVSGFVGAGRGPEAAQPHPRTGCGDHRLSDGDRRRPAPGDLQQAPLQRHERDPAARQARPALQVAPARRPDARQGLAGPRRDAGARHGDQGRHPAGRAGGGAHRQRGAGRGDRAARGVHGRGRHGDADELRARTAGGRPAGGDGAPARPGGAAGHRRRTPSRRAGRQGRRRREHPASWTSPEAGRGPGGVRTRRGRRAHRPRRIP